MTYAQKKKWITSSLPTLARNEQAIHFKISVFFRKSQYVQFKKIAEDV